MRDGAALPYGAKDTAGGKTGQSAADSPDISPPAFKIRSVSGDAAPPLAGDAVGVRGDAALPCGARGAAGWRARGFGFPLRRYCAKMGSAAMGGEAGAPGLAVWFGLGGLLCGTAGLRRALPAPAQGTSPLRIPFSSGGWGAVIGGPIGADGRRPAPLSSLPRASCADSGYTR